MKSKIVRKKRTHISLPHFLLFIHYLSFGYLIYISQIIPANIMYVFLECLGVILMTWSTIMLRQRTYTIYPYNAPVILSGPYSFIRHPLYLGILIVSGSLLMDMPTRGKYILFSIILITSFILINIEESMLTKKNSTYRKYLTKTYRLIPFIY